MTHHLLVLDFGAQCPWQPWIVDQARRAAEQLGGTVRVADVTQQPDLAARYRLFFPFMTVVDGTICLPSPTPAEELVRIAAEGLAMAPATPTTWGSEARAETVLPLTGDNIADTCHLCIRPDELRGCGARAVWAVSMAHQVPDGILGFAAYHKGQAVGVVEFLPAPLVPYPLADRASDVAFITCLYSTQHGPDYRGQVRGAAGEAPARNRLPWTAGRSRTADALPQWPRGLLPAARLRNGERGRSGRAAGG